MFYAILPTLADLSLTARHTISAQDVIGPFKDQSECEAYIHLALEGKTVYDWGSVFNGANGMREIAQISANGNVRRLY